MKSQKIKAVVLAATLSLVSISSFGAIVYDNTTTDVGQYYPSPANNEFGDQVNLAGTERVVTDFSFYAYLNAASLSGQSVVFSFYNNVGNGIAPGTLLFQSDPQPMALGFQTFTATGLSVTVPSTFTWTVAFSGLAAGQDAGLLVYSPPTVGSSFNDFWEESGAGGPWGLMQIAGGATPANFAARITAVPEPGVLALGALGVLAFAGLKRMRQAKS